MSKYVIDLRPDCKVVQQICESDGQLSIHSKWVNYLKELNSDYINEHFGDLQDTAYKKGLHDGESKCGYCNEYQRGLDDAWEAARKLFSSMADSDIEKAFPIEWNNGGFHALINLQPQEAIVKLKAYEDDKIKRGDIVNVKGSCNDDLLGVVTKVWEDNCYIMWGDGSGGAWCKKSVVKTGKHIDVDKFLGGLSSDN